MVLSQLYLVVVILLIDVEFAYVPFNDVALDRTDDDLIRVEFAPLIVHEDAALVKDDEFVILALPT